MMLFKMLFKNGLVSLFAFVLLTSVVLAQQPQQSAQRPRSATPAADPAQAKAEALKFDKETGKLALDNLEKMRAMNIKNTNTVFDKLVENQKALNKLTQESIANNKNGSDVQAKSQDMQKEIQKLNQELAKQVDDENAKFQAMMKKRLSEQAAKNATRASQP